MVKYTFVFVASEYAVQLICKYYLRYSIMQTENATYETDIMEADTPNFYHFSSEEKYTSEFCLEAGQTSSEIKQK